MIVQPTELYYIALRPLNIRTCHYRRHTAAKAPEAGSVRRIKLPDSISVCITTVTGNTLAAMLMGLAMVFAATAVLAQQNLPSMGEPADSALSPMEEQLLGAQFMRQIRARLPLVRDVQVTEYIQALGDQLVLASGKVDAGNFTFFVIDDPQINAFAIPGGYIGINSGLIAAMAHEEQLASVLAHEIAHVTQRHHARAFATGNRASLSAAAAVLAAIIIGQASPQAGQAALAAGLAASQQSAINFTRGNEVEADRIGIEILANANYDPRAMAETFDILRRQNSLNTSGLVLEYLRTHPLDTNRIAEASDRAALKPKMERVNSVEFNLFKARLAVLGSSDPGQTKRVYQSRFQRQGDAQSAYALALMAKNDNRMDEAREYLDTLDSLVEANPMVEILRADIQSSHASTDEKLASLSLLYPDRYSIVEKRLDALVQKRQLPDAADVATRYIRTNSQPNPLAWRQLASIQQQLDNEAGSHESLARYFEALDELERAQGQLELALRQVPKGSQDEIRLSASLRNLKNKAARLR